MQITAAEAHANTVPVLLQLAIRRHSADTAAERQGLRESTRDVLIDYSDGHPVSDQLTDLVHVLALLAAKSVAESDEARGSTVAERFESVAGFAADVTP